MARKFLLFVTFALITAVAVPGCAKKRTIKKADEVAKTGDWETALTQYKLAQASHPADAQIAERVRRAEREVAQVYIQRAADANAKGDLGQAGELWRKALEMTPDPVVQEMVKAEIFSNASSLEYFGDVSSDFYAWEDALGAYGALLLVQPNSVELLEKYREAKREFAGDLSVVSDELQRKNLKGAALVTSLRALAHDPMQQGAFDRVTVLRRELAGRTRVAVQAVEVEEKDHGARTFALALVPNLTPSLDDYSPYGPTKDPKALPANFVAVIESVSKDEKTVTGEDVLPNTIPASKEPIVNPAIAEQEKVVAGLNKELKELQEQVKKSKPGRQPRPAATKPAPKAAAKNTKKGKKAPEPVVVEESKSVSAKKKKLQEAEEAKRQQGLELARQVDKKRKEIATALADLKALPATVAPPPPPPTFTLGWKEVTRTVTAKVRFELRERDFGEPITLTIEKTLSKTDRTHNGNEKQGVFADALELPSFEAMYQELATQFGEGAGVIAKARDRRVERVLAEARNKKAMGEDEQALDAYVESLFLLGAEQLPEDAAVEVAKSAENEKLLEILGGTEKR
jgi:hypothetical protein